MKYTIILTTYKEPNTIGKAIEQIVKPNLDIWRSLQLVVVATDKETITAAKKTIKDLPTNKNIYVIQDKGKGKPAALNLATQLKQLKNTVLILTDGDVYISNDAIKDIIKKMQNPDTYIVSGHPISLEDRKTKFGFYSHLFCSAADYKRKTDSKTPASGYLYAIKNWEDIFPLPEDIRAEDAYISQKMIENGYTVEYAQNAIVNVMFPKNTKDWIKQKTRSLGGNIQLESFNATKTRSISEDIGMLLYPIKYAKTPKEYLYLLYLYPLRLFLWIKIFILNKTHKLGTGRWESIKSSKY